MTPSVQAEAYKMSGVYTLRQHLRMKWVTLLISGLAATYTIQNNAWILEMTIPTWGAAMAMMFISQWHLNKLFVEHVKHMRAGNEFPLPMLMKAITQHAWLQWGVGLVVWYWILTLGYISFFTEIPAGT